MVARRNDNNNALSRIEEKEKSIGLQTLPLYRNIEKEEEGIISSLRVETRTKENPFHEIRNEDQSASRFFLSFNVSLTNNITKKKKKKVLVATKR